MRRNKRTFAGYLLSEGEEAEGVTRGTRQQTTDFDSPRSSLENRTKSFSYRVDRAKKISQPYSATTKHGSSPAMAGTSITAKVKKLRQVVDSLGTAAAFGKIQVILEALEMQVDDGNFQRRAVTRLCEALLATAELYDVPEHLARQLEEATCAVVTLVEDRR